MAEVTLSVHRKLAASSLDQPAIERFHRARSEFAHSLVEALNLEVLDWGETDAERPREVVEIIIALGSAGAISGLVTIITTAIKERKIKDLVLTGPKGSLSLRGVSAKDAIRIAEAVGISPEV